MHSAHAHTVLLQGLTNIVRVVCVCAVSHTHRYLTTIQGALYKATPPFGVYTARVDALRELRKQLHVLNDAADPAGPYLAVRAI